MGTFLSISDALPATWRVQFVMRIQGTTFSECWGERMPPQSGVAPPHHFRFLQWLDPVAAGSAGPVSYRACDLICGDDLTPIEYTVRSGGETAIFRITNGKVDLELASGQHLDAQVADIDLLLDANVIPQLDLAVRLMAGDAFDGQILSPNALRTIDYGLERLGAGFRSSMGEVITLAEDGGIKSIHVEGIEIAKVPFDLPDWAARAGDMIVDTPAPYSPPATIDFREFSFAGPDVEHLAAIAGPKAPEKATAAAVFFAGSGRIDRHGFSGFMDIGTHQVLDALAERGVVSLRYDKRGAGATALGSDTLEPSFNGVLDDARGAAAALRAAPEAAGLPVFYVGHSQGGLVALILAQDVPRPEGIVLLATAGRAIDQVLADQVRSQAAQLELSDQVLSERLGDLDTLFAHVRRGPPSAETVLPPKIEAQRHVLRWYREQLAFDPIEAIKKIDLPILLLRGTKDEQAFEADDQAFLDTAEAAGLDLTYRPIEGVDHLLMPYEGGGLADYTKKDRKVAASVVDEIANWIAAQAADKDRGDAP